MANAAPTKPAVSRLRKWSRRFALLGLLLVLAAVAWFAGGRDIVGRMVLNWARGRLERQLAESREQLPEIADYEALLRKEVKGSNGWEHIEAGCRATKEIERRHQNDDKTVFSIHGSGDFTDAWNIYIRDDNPHGLGNIRPKQISLVLSETEVLAGHAGKASNCDCIVDLETYSAFVTEKKNGRNKHEHMASQHRFIGALITRVRLLALTEEFVKANGEIRVLVAIGAKLNVSLSKQKATDQLGTRNDVLEHGVLPLLRSGLLDATTKQALLTTRWRTPGKDPQLWLNNAAFAYDFQHGGLTDEIEMYFESESASPFGAARFILANADWMDVATKNAQAAKRGELDLRDNNWVEHYNAQYESPFALVNGAVPCGRETMSWLVREVEREDKLWAEIEALAKR